MDDRPVKKVEVHRCLLVQRRATAIDRAFEIGGARLDDTQRYRIRLTVANPRTALEDKEARLIELAKLLGIALTFSDTAIAVKHRNESVGTGG